jgi:hypothetical protein
MKKIFYIILLITGITNAQVVNIPDANFKAKLLEASPTNTIAYTNGLPIVIDTNNNGDIENSEAIVIDSLVVSSSNISSLLGISSFTNLKKLSCSTNNLTDLDVTNLTNLEFLNCADNQISSLFVSGLSNLNTLNCFGNQLPVLDLTGLTNLEKLFVNTNNLTALDLSSNTNIKWLYCGFNQITSLNLTGLTQLEILFCASNLLNDLNFGGIQTLWDVDCSQNLLSSLNLTGLSHLKYLRCSANAIESVLFPVLSDLQIIDCAQNQLTALDFTHLNQLEILACDFNQLIELDFSNNPHFSNLNCSNNNLQFINLKNGINQSDNNIGAEVWDNNPNLRFVCVDNSELLLIQDLIAQSNLNPVNLNSYCDFVPGGDYNTITGNFRFDADSNGCDSSDIAPISLRVNLNDGTNQGASFTNANGSYDFYTPAGSFEIMPAIENPTWFTISPASATISFADQNNNIANQDFCVSSNGIHPDVEVVISPVFFAIPGFDASYQITFRNKGNQLFSNGLISLQYDDAVLDFVSASQAPFSQAFGSINWQYTNLLPFEARAITITLNVNNPTEIPAVNIGDQLNFIVSTFPSETDEIPQDNTFEYIQTVVGSFDPNDITCLEGDVVAPSEIGNYLHYVVNFENTGTFAAENIVVKVDIDTVKYDINSLQLLNTSNPAYTKITGNVVEFVFKNIMLDTGGHGNVLFKIKSNPTLVVGDSVTNRADIFFDYNFPIDTGMANTVFQALSNTDFEIDNFVLVAPNPASNELTIKAEHSIKTIQLYDAQGRVILISLVNAPEFKLDVSSYSKGIYFIKITTDKGIKVQKLQKE